MIRVLFFLLISIFSASAQVPDHSDWSILLKKYVTKEGKVNYAGFKKEKIEFDTYLQKLTTNPPKKNQWTKQDQLAYWINAYNAFTLKIIVDNYPIKSIKDLNPTIAVPLVNTVWQKKFFKIGSEEMSLDDIEHSILRKEFNEPRIHFAINCASISCPILMNEAYTGVKIEEQLQKQAVVFINDSSRNKISKNKVRLSNVFNWFGKDFTKDGTLIDFINKYSEVKANKNASVQFLEYNWNLNE